MLVGPPGTGKTHLAIGIVNELVRTEAARCLFCDYRELLKTIQNSYTPSGEATESQILRPVLDIELLVLDDLGAVRTSEWVWDTASSVINHRYNERKTTIITTNFPDLPERNSEGPVEGFSLSARTKKAAQNETLGDRVTNRMFSRLHEMCRVVELKGIDFRMAHGRKLTQGVHTTGSAHSRASGRKS